MSSIGGHTSIMGVIPGGVPQEVITGARTPSATADGRTIVFVTPGADDPSEIWKADADDRGRTKLAAGVLPLVTPDGRSVIFSSTQSGTQTPWIVPTGGGTPRQIVDFYVGSGGVAVSPDSKFMVMPDRSSPGRSAEGWLICDFPGCSNRRNIPGPTWSRPRWTPTGDAIAGIRNLPDMPNNIWVLPLEGGGPRQLTHFTDEDPIVDFAWSHDGKRLAVLRGTQASDIVLFRGLKRSLR